MGVEMKMPQSHGRNMQVSDVTGMSMWVPHETKAFTAARDLRITQGSGKKTVLVYEDTETKERIEVPEDKKHLITEVEEDHLMAVPDVTTLRTVTHASVLETVKRRYKQNQIYTKVDDVIISVNPFAVIPGLYDAEAVSRYENCSDPREMPPHVYCISKNAMMGLYENKDQAILISGESGAGKTENCKILLHYFTQSAASNSGIQDRIMQCNPLLEAFGNAKTSRNNNSSRFGKWTALHFSMANEIEGAGLIDYLLEKSRAVSQNQPERSFHIFHMMLQDPKKYGLSSNKNTDYFHLQNSAATADGWDDKKELGEVLAACQDTTMSSEVSTALLRATAGVLLLGNVALADGGNDTSKCDNMATLQAVCDVWECDPTVLIDAICNKKLTIGKEVTMKALKLEDAKSSRKSLATLYYSKIFQWLVAFLNGAIQGTTTTTSRNTSGKTKEIGMLDIAGFESFEFNTWEQITINLSNENLQQHFNDYIFKAEMRDYEAEGVPTDDFKFEDNQEILDTIGGQQNSIFFYLDGTTKNIKATDEVFMNQLRTNMKDNKYLTLDRFNKPQFTLQHYAGPVTYDVQGWAQIKNKDEPPPEALDILKTCNNLVMVQIFEKMSEEERQKKITVSQQFRASLRDLMAVIYQSQPHFVRCIKPNSEKKAQIFTPPMALEQLTNSGVIEAVRIRQAGYPYRALPEDFFRRYRVCIPLNLQKQAQNAGGLTSAAGVKIILDGLPGAFSMPDLKGQYHMGKTKVMAKQKGHAALDEQARIAKVAKAILIQKVFRGYRARKRVKVARETRKAIQKWLATYPLYAAPGKDGMALLGGCEGIVAALAQLSLWLDVANRSTDLRVAPDNFGPTVEALKKELSVMQRADELMTSFDVMDVKNAVSTLKALKIDNDFSQKLEKRADALAREAPLLKGMQALPPLPYDAGAEVHVMYQDMVAGVENAGLAQEQAWLDKTGFALYVTVKEVLAKFEAGPPSDGTSSRDAANAAEAAAIVAAVLATSSGAGDRMGEMSFSMADNKEQLDLAAGNMQRGQTALEGANSLLQAGDSLSMSLVENLHEAIDAKEETVAQLDEVINTLPEGSDQLAELENAKQTAAEEKEQLDSALAMVCAQSGMDPLKVATIKAEFEKKKSQRLAESTNEGKAARVSEKMASLKPSKSMRLTITDAADALIQLEDALEVYDGPRIQIIYQYGIENGIDAKDLRPAEEMLSNLMNAEYVRAELMKNVERLLHNQDLTENQTTKLLKASTNLVAAAEKAGVAATETTSISKTLKKTANAAFGSMFVGKDKDDETREVGQILFSRWDLAPIINTTTVKTRYKRDGTKVDPLDPLGACSWTKYKIPGSLTNLPNTQLTDAAMNIFKNLCAWMCDHPVDNKRRAPLAFTIIHKAKNDEFLTNEVYAMIMKQLTNNPGLRSKLLGWKLMQHLLNQVPPQANFIEYVRAFILNSIDKTETPEVENLPEDGRKMLLAVQNACWDSMTKYDATAGNTTEVHHKSGDGLTVQVWSMEGFDIREQTARLDATCKPRKPKLVALDDLKDLMTAQDVALRTATQHSLSTNQSEFSLFRTGHAEPLSNNKNLIPMLKKEPQLELMFKRRFIKPREVVSTVDMVFTCLTVEQALQEYLLEYHVPENEHKLAWIAAQIAVYLTRARQTKQFVANENTLKFLLPAQQIGRRSPVDWRKMIMSELYLNHVLENAGTSHLARAAVLLKSLQRLKAFATRQFVGRQRSRAELESEESKQVIAKLSQGKVRQPLVDMAQLDLLCCVSISSVTFFNNTQGDKSYGQEVAKVGFSAARGHHLVEWDADGNAVYLAMRLPKGKEVFLLFDTEQAERLVDRMDRAYCEDYQDEGKREERPNLTQRITKRNVALESAGEVIMSHSAQVPGSQQASKYDKKEQHQSAVVAAGGADSFYPTLLGSIRGNRSNMSGGQGDAIVSGKGSATQPGSVKNGSVAAPGSVVDDFNATTSAQKMSQQQNASTVSGNYYAGDSTGGSMSPTGADAAGASATMGSGTGGIGSPAQQSKRALSQQQQSGIQSKTGSKVASMMASQQNGANSFVQQSTSQNVDPETGAPRSASQNLGMGSGIAPMSGMEEVKGAEEDRISAGAISSYGGIKRLNSAKSLKQQQHSQAFDASTSSSARSAATVGGAIKLSNKTASQRGGPGSQPGSATGSIKQSTVSSSNNESVIEPSVVQSRAGGNTLDARSVAGVLPNAAAMPNTYIQSIAPGQKGKGKAAINGSAFVSNFGIQKPQGGGAGGMGGIDENASIVVQPRGGNTLDIRSDKLSQMPINIPGGQSFGAGGSVPMSAIPESGMQSGMPKSGMQSMNQSRK
ncbi:unnamed protein product [Amoebophrya sp. A120]|nr:unnamed protein product [Amoebophrya sp. A120]|eukprot:GSA120T00014991001.1